MPNPIDLLADLCYPSMLSLSTTLDPLTGGAGAAVAVVALTCAVRLLLLPIAVRQARSQARLRALGPQLGVLRERHAGDPARLAHELRTSYREAGVSPLGSIGTGLLQLPVLWVVYRLCSASTIGGHANELLGSALFGAPMAARWLQVPFGSGTVVVIGLLVVALLTAWWSSRRLRREGTPAVLRLLPFATVLALPVLPLAAGIYVTTSALWSAVERAVFSWLGVS